MPNETSAEKGRSPGLPTLRVVLLGAAAGAGLFLGVGVAMPPWNGRYPFQGGHATFWQAADSLIGMACHEFVDRGLFLLLPLGAVFGIVSGPLGCRVWNAGRSVWRPTRTRPVTTGRKPGTQ